MYAIPDHFVEMKVEGFNPNVDLTRQLFLGDHEPILLPEGENFIVVSVDENGVEINASTVDANHKTSSKLGYDAQLNAFIKPEGDTQYPDHFFVEPDKVGGELQGECMAFGCNITISGKIRYSNSDSDSKSTDEGITLRITRSNLN